MNTKLKLAVLASIMFPAACTSPNANNSLTRLSTSEVAVDYQDLDLETDVGRDELRQRIATAARMACNSGHATGLDTFLAVRCEKRARAPHLQKL